MPARRNGWGRKRKTQAVAQRVRDYANPKHKAARAAALAELNRRGSMPCPRCPHPVLPGQSVHLDHTDDRSGYLGLSHAACNLKAAARKGARIRNARQRTVTRRRLLG